MLIATFNSATGWAGKTIDYDDGRFTLEDHGPISAADVLAYDQQGHVAWAYEGLREWVTEQARETTPAAPLMGAAVARSSVSGPRANAKPLVSRPRAWVGSRATTAVIVPTDSSAAARERPIESYGVIYLGGHPAYPNSKVGKIDLAIFQDRFEFAPTSTSKWFASMTIPYETVIDLEVVQRQVGTVEGLLGGLNSRQLNQANNVHIRYADGGMVILLRLEMLSGVTVMGQAKKCRQLEDRLRIHGIREKFRQAAAAPSDGAMGADDIPTQIERLAGLRDKGLISAEEFEVKKTELLSRM